jgi:8-oxo-dGTP pyrophosphatase MutT (NUDIX family)
MSDDSAHGAAKVGPWRRISTRLVYENPWIRVREDQVITPTGSPGIYGVVDARLAVGIVALTSDLKIYLVGQHRYPTDVYSWEIPEGGGEDGESPLLAAQRELREETGLSAGSWEPLGSEVHLSNCFTSERAYLFVARDLSLGSPAPDQTEQLKVRVVSLIEAVRMVESGEIYDGLTIIAILRAARIFGV